MTCALYSKSFKDKPYICVRNMKNLGMLTNQSSQICLMREFTSIWSLCLICEQTILLSQNFSAKHLIQYTKEWFICKWSGSWVGIIESALWRGRLITNSDLHFDLFPSQSFGMTWKHKECNIWSYTFNILYEISIPILYNCMELQVFFKSSFGFHERMKVIRVGTTWQWVKNAYFCILFDSALDARMQ